MKIVIVLDWFLYYSIELANSLVREHDVLLITRDHNYEISSAEAPVSLDDFLDNVLDPRIHQAKMHYRRSSIGNLKELPRVLTLIKRFAPDIIHVQETSDWRILFLAKMFAKNRIVLTIHDIVSHPGESKGFQGFISGMLRQAAAKVIVHGRYLKEQLQHIHPDMDASVHVVPLGVISLYKKCEVGEVGEERLTILFFGRLSKYKGLDILLEAHRLVLRTIPNAKLIIAGKGETLPISLVEDAQREWLEIHHRYIPNSEVSHFFRRASVVVLPYTEASQSAVIPIAYSFSKPVVVTDVGSIPEVVKDGTTGFIVAPNDPNALAEALIKILGDNELRRALGRNAQEMVEAELSWATIAKITEEVYSS